MFISPAYAQAGGGGGDFLISIAPLILIFVVFWFFLIRPQQQKAKQHREMVSSLRRHDQVLTGGGIVGRVAKVLDDVYVMVEIADNLRVKVARATITDVLTKGQPVKGPSEKSKERGRDRDEDDEDEHKDGGAPEAEAKPAEPAKKPLFSFGAKK